MIQHFSFTFFAFAMQPSSTPVMSSNLRNQAPLFTELRLLQGTLSNSGNWDHQCVWVMASPLPLFWVVLQRNLKAVCLGIDLGKVHFCWPGWNPTTDQWLVDVAFCRYSMSRALLPCIFDQNNNLWISIKQMNENDIHFWYNADKNFQYVTFPQN